MIDWDLIIDKHFWRKCNHPYREKSKALSSTFHEVPSVGVSDLVDLHTDGNKSQARDRFLVVAVEGI